MRRNSAAWLVLFIQVVILVLFIRELSSTQWTDGESDENVIGQSDSTIFSSSHTVNNLNVSIASTNAYESHK
jgi:hypothetical protein